jgi:hypothetical protein
MYAAWQGGALRNPPPLTVQEAAADRFAKIGRFNPERMQLMKRQDYNQIVALLQKAERKR